jgi:hypothetical protein
MNVENKKQAGYAIGAVVGFSVGVIAMDFTPLLAVWIAVGTLLGRSVVSLLLITNKK